MEDIFYLRGKLRPLARLHQVLSKSRCLSHIAVLRRLRGAFQLFRVCGRNKFGGFCAIWCAERGAELFNSLFIAGPRRKRAEDIIVIGHSLHPFPLFTTQYMRPRGKM